MACLLDIKSSVELLNLYLARKGRRRLGARRSTTHLVQMQEFWPGEVQTAILYSDGTLVLNGSKIGLGRSTNTLYEKKLKKWNALGLI